MASVTQFTIQYRTFLKRAVRQAMAAALSNHPDPTVTRTDVALDFSLEDFTLPIVIVGFKEQALPNAGVGHYEWWPAPDFDEGNPIYIEYQHRLYKGSVTFDIYAQSTIDRDVVADAIVETLAMDEVSTSGLAFINRFYNEIQANSPAGVNHFPTLNTDQITPNGEQTVPPPWRPEDALIYQTGYSLTVFGEFYSYVPPSPVGSGPVVEVDVYEYPVDGSGKAIDPTLPAPPLNSDGTPNITGLDYQEYTGFLVTEEVPEGPGGN